LCKSRTPPSPDQLPTPENDEELVQIHDKVAFAYKRLLPESKFCQLDNLGKQERVEEHRFSGLQNVYGPKTVLAKYLSKNTSGGEWGLATLDTPHMFPK
jgi:hypothetical protein